MVEEFKLIDFIGKLEKLINNPNIEGATATPAAPASASQSTPPTSADLIKQISDQFESFNKHNEQKFKFQLNDLSPNKRTFFKNQIGDLLFKTTIYLNINTLDPSSSSSSSSLSLDSTSLLAFMRLGSACLDTIRLISRDTQAIELFYDEKLLSQIQQIANLDTRFKFQSPSIKQQEIHPMLEISRDFIALSALKAMSNLIYNSKYAQDFYSRNSVAETIILHLKQFHPTDFLNTPTSAAAASATATANAEQNESNVLSHKSNVMLFNLKILFLLTVFNKELRQKLREKLQVITYLIEIIDQIMKERLSEENQQQNNISSSSSSSPLSATVPSMSHSNDPLLISANSQQSDSLDYCYLKRIDIDFIIEILKILYNLTMDMQNVRANAIATLSSTSTHQITTTTMTSALQSHSSHFNSSSGGSSGNINNINNNNNSSMLLEEEEAHLMHLVSVLRDLITCKLEDDESLTPAASINNISIGSKLNDLHSNIINLLTNMPTICFEELMAPCLNTSASSTSGLSQTFNFQLNDNNNSSMTTTQTSFSVSAKHSFNARLEHNKKRMSRRSKRIRQKQDNSTLSVSSGGGGGGSGGVGGSGGIGSSGARRTVSEEPSLIKRLNSLDTNNKENKPTTSNLNQNQTMTSYDTELFNPDEDLEFEGKNMEAIAIILSFMSRHVTNYLNKQPMGPNKMLTYSNPALADQLYPVLMLLSLMAKSNKHIRHYCRLKVLPPLKRNDLIDLPQNGVSIRNRLVRLMTDPNIQIKRLSAQFLFILCKESIGRLIKYTGYGNAAGLLAEAGLMLSTHGDRSAYSDDSDDSDSDDYKNLENKINPITGRAELDEDDDEDFYGGGSKSSTKSSTKTRFKKKDLFEGMTEEQKEYEALKLVNTIDKLMVSGVIKPAVVGPDGRPAELEHVLQLQESSNSVVLGASASSNTNTTTTDNQSIRKKNIDQQQQPSPPHQSDSD